MTGTSLDASCPIAPLMPYLLHFNATAAQEWADEEAASFASSVPVAVAITVGSALMLLAGKRLVRVALFLCGFLVAFGVSILVTDSALGAVSASPTVGCITLITVPLIFGGLGGALTLYLLNLAFACVGFAVGAAVGQFAYLLFLHHVTTGITILNHDLMYFLVVLALAIPGSFLMAIYKEDLIIIATAALGAAGLVPGLAILLLSRIDARFLWVTDPSDANVHRSSPYVYGQMLAAIPYFLVGVAVQRKMHCKRAAAAAVEVQPYTRWNGSSNA